MLIKKSKFSLSAGAIVPLALALLSISAHASLVTNGSFESNGGVGELAGGISFATGWSVGAPTDATDPFVFIVDGNADTTGFPSVFSPGAGTNIFVWGPGRGVNNGFTTSPDGGYFLGADTAYANAPISQVVTGLTVGNDYTLSFYFAGSQFTDATGANFEGWRVSFGGDTVNTSTLNNASQGFTGWQSYSHTFTASSASQTLSFLATGGPTGLPPFALLDGISLTQDQPVESSTPEPSSLFLIAGSLGALGVARFRRNRR